MTDTPPERPGAPAVGPLALEAALLLDVVADRLTSMKRSAAPAAGNAPAPSREQPTADESTQTPPNPEQAAGGHPAGARSAAGPSPAAPRADGRCPECGSIPGASCTVCPLCRFIALLRGERPEATARLVDGALMIVRTLRSLVPDAPEPPPPGSAPPADPAPPPPRRGGLEHIDIL